MRIFLDANILYSAAVSDGAVRYLLESLHAGRHALCADDYVVVEARRNLLAKAEHAMDVFEQLLAGLEISSARIENAPAPLISWLPEKDRPVLQAAIRLRCDALVTGDVKHFRAGFGKSFGGVVIYSPRLLAEALL